MDKKSELFYRFPMFPNPDTSVDLHSDVVVETELVAPGREGNKVCREGAVCASSCVQIILHLSLSQTANSRMNTTNIG